MVVKKSSPTSLFFLQYSLTCMRRSTLQLKTKRTYFTIKSIDELRVHIDIPKSIEQWEPTYLRRSAPSILYSNAMNACCEWDDKRYICAYRLVWRIPVIRMFLICIVLFSCRRLVQLMRNVSLIKERETDEKQQTGNSNGGRFETCCLLISKKEIVYIYREILE